MESPHDLQAMKATHGINLHSIYTSEEENCFPEKILTFELNCRWLNVGFFPNFS